MLTIQLVKLSFAGSLAAIIILLLVPAGVYTAVFGHEFEAIKRVIALLTPGILALAVSTIFTHYFSGLGKNHINTIASGIGLLFTIIFCYILIPRYGLQGAAIATSSSYFTSLAFLSYKFISDQDIRFKDFNFKKSDFNTFLAILKKD